RVVPPGGRGGGRGRRAAGRAGGRAGPRPGYVRHLGPPPRAAGGGATLPRPAPPRPRRPAISPAYRPAAGYHRPALTPASAARYRSHEPHRVRRSRHVPIRRDRLCTARARLPPAAGRSPARREGGEHGPERLHPVGGPVE